MVNETWGGRFQKSPDKQMLDFNSSLKFDHLLYPYDIQGSIAHVKMLARQNIITKEEAGLLQKGLEEVRQDLSQRKIAFSDVYEDIHMLIEHVLVQKVGDVGKKLHTGRSRNDQVALDLRIYARDMAQHIEGLLQNLLETLQELALEHAKNIMPGYTHLQQAQPVYLGHYFDAYAHMFRRDLNRLKDWYERMNFSPLGAGALAGSCLPLDRQWVAKELGFSGIIDNTLDAVSDRDYVVEFCSFASILFVHLSRLSEDLILWATQEFNFVKLDDAFATGSSLMPNKKNPDILELIRGKSGRIFGNLMSILTVMKGLPLAYNKDMQEDKENLFDTFTTLDSCLKIITPFLKSLEFNTVLMEQKVHSGYLDATAAVEKLVMKGVPFRDAHHEIGRLVHIAQEKGCSLNDLINEK